MKKLIYITISLSILLLFAFRTPVFETNKVVFELVSKTKAFEAGSLIELSFTSVSTSLKPQLFMIHSYGKTLLDAKSENGTYTFTLPMNYAEKSGVVSWFLIHEKEKKTEGTFEIIPNEKAKINIENYLGPRSILAGGSEFTMMVTVPTDCFDNPKKENTSVLIKSQFLEIESVVNLKTKNFIAWYAIYSPSKAGKLIVSSECDQIATKEIETEIYPNIPIDFKINYTRNHEYADGNQITSFSTDIIKDKFGNTVSDGTMVSFIIKTKNNLVLKTFGSTIKGIAIGQILHPDHQEEYIIKGFVTGMAQSNSLQLKYKPLIGTFKFSFLDKNRTIQVGPLKSFMNQLVPDGIKVSVKVFDGNELVSTLEEYSSKGFVKFYLSKDLYKSKEYRFEITALGIKQKTENLNYEFN